MYVDHTPEQKELRDELRRYLKAQPRPERSGEEGGAAYRESIRRLGADGWLGLGWPREYGGQGRSAVEQLIFFDEARRAGVPLPFVTLNTVGPALMEHGSEEQKRRFLPQILSGQVHFAIGYSEPDAGTDLASLQTRAERDGEVYVINGTKVFTSGAGDADYIWLAARTDPQAPKHRGISIFILDTQLPGFSFSPIRTLAGVATTMTYYENVRVPVSMRVGEENAGWSLITTQLNHERVALAAWGGMAHRLYEETLHWARETVGEDDAPVIEQPWVQMALAESYARLEAMKVLNWRMAWELQQGRLDPGQASCVKVYGTECLIDVYRLLLEVVGPVGALRVGSPGAWLRGDLEWEYRACQVNTFGGGVNEIQREIVAMVGLQMPRPPR